MLLRKDSSEWELNSKLCSHHLSRKKYDIGATVTQAAWKGKAIYKCLQSWLNTPHGVEANYSKNTFWGDFQGWQSNKKASGIKFTTSADNVNVFIQPD